MKIIIICICFFALTQSLLSQDVIFLDENDEIIEEIDLNSFTEQYRNIQYCFRIPDNWDYSHCKAKNNSEYILIRNENNYEDSTLALNFLPYEFEYYYADFPLMFIATSLKLDRKCLDMESYLDSLQKVLKTDLQEYSPDNSNLKISKQDFVVKHYFGMNNIFYLTVAHYEGTNFFASIALMSRNKAEHLKNFNAYKALINSYQVISTKAPIKTDDIEYKYGNIDYKLLEKEKKECYNNYLIELSSRDYLELAFKKNSKKMLDTFFWANSQLEPPISSELLSKKPELEQEIYKLYNDFVKPRDFMKYFSSYEREPDEDYYSTVDKFEYFLAQTSLHIALIDTSRKEEENVFKKYYKSKDTIYYYEVSKFDIYNFKSKINFPKNKVVYCDESLIKLIKSFIGFEFTEGSIYNLPKMTSETKRRVEFLNQLVDIEQMHWGNDFQIVNTPWIMRIEMMKGYNSATVHFMMGKIICAADLYKKDGKWIVKSCGQSVIQ